MAWLELSLRRQFRDLHLMLLSIADERRPLSPAVRDEVLSYGERLSSEVVTAAIQSSGISAVHIDSRQVIVTDAHHTQAQPLLWGTYAKVRRIIPILGRDRVVVMGGFIGATEDGATTTLGLAADRTSLRHWSARVFPLMKYRFGKTWTACSPVTQK